MDKTRFSNFTPSPDGKSKQLFWRAAIKLLERVRPYIDGNILALTPNICVKFRGNPAETAAMRFLAKETSLPVPKIYCAIERKDTTYIVMQKMPGQMIGQGWSLRTEDSQRKLLAQLKGIIQEMRHLPCPPGVCVANVDGGPLYDTRMPSHGAFGPFDTVQAFQYFLRSGNDVASPNLPTLAKMIAMHKEIPERVCFTHGDLSSFNILAKGDRITGIIDWEFGGWYPYYWEYASACKVNPWNVFWREEIDKFLEVFEQELEMDRIRDQFFGDIPYASDPDPLLQTGHESSAV